MVFTNRTSITKEQKLQERALQSVFKDSISDYETLLSKEGVDSFQYMYWNIWQWKFTMANFIYSIKFANMSVTHNDKCAIKTTYKCIFSNIYIYILFEPLKSLVWNIHDVISWEGGKEQARHGHWICKCVSYLFTTQKINNLFFNTLRPRQKGRHFADDIFKWIFLNENVWIPIKISLKFVPQGPINNILALVQIMAWRRPGDKPLSGPMMVRLPTHICVTRPQWVNSLWPSDAIWRNNNVSTLVKVMFCCLTAPSYYQHQYWLFISEVPVGSSETVIIRTSEDINQ